MTVVHMMKAAIDQIIHMISVRHGFMSAIRSVHMASFVTLGPLCAVIRIRGTDLNFMLIDMIAMNMVKVAIMKVILMAIMLYGGVPATRTMLMGMVLVLIAFIHENTLFF